MVWHRRDAHMFITQIFFYFIFLKYRINVNINVKTGGGGDQTIYLSFAHHDDFRSKCTLVEARGTGGVSGCCCSHCKCASSPFFPSLFPLHHKHTKWRYAAFTQIMIRSDDDVSSIFQMRRGFPVIYMFIFLYDILDSLPVRVFILRSLSHILSYNWVHYERE